MDKLMDFNAHCVLFSSEMVLPLLLISDKRNRIYPQSFIGLSNFRVIKLHPKILNHRFAE